MPDGLYDRDVLIWSEHQSDLLRRLAAGERLNEAVDWPNVIEEIESVGRSEWRSCESALLQALVHLLKLYVWPESAAVSHWRDELTGFLNDAERRCAPSMTQRIDLADLYADALYRLRAKVDESGPPRLLPQTCPFALDELLAKHINPSDLLAVLAAPKAGESSP